MKILISMWAILFLFVIYSAVAQAATYRFCSGVQEDDGVVCSEIEPSNLWGNWQYCRSWASSQGLSYRGTYINSNLSALEQTQSQICDVLVGMSKWSCYMIEDCGMTSSLSPISIEVFAPNGNVEQARDNCVKKGWQIFKDKLINLQHGCKIAPDAAIQ